MKKYIYCFKLHFLNAINYRFNTVVELLFGNLRLLIVIFFWNLVYGGDAYKTLNGFTLPGIVTYLVVIDIFGALIFRLRNSGFDYADMIKRGSLGPAILKPHNLGITIYFRNLAGGVTGMIPQAALIMCALPFVARFFTWEADAVSVLSIPLFLFAGTITAHLLCSLLGYMAFWLEESNAVMWSFVVLLNMLTGFFLPLDFFPGWSIYILEVLPVASWGYIPAKACIGLYSYGKLAYLLIVQIAWIGILLRLNASVWRRGAAKYSSVGG